MPEVRAQPTRTEAVEVGNGLVEMRFEGRASPRVGDRCRLGFDVMESNGTSRRNACLCGRVRDGRKLVVQRRDRLLLGMSFVSLWTAPVRYIQLLVDVAPIPSGRSRGWGNLGSHYKHFELRRYRHCGRLGLQGDELAHAIYRRLRRHRRYSDSGMTHCVPPDTVAAGYITCILNGYLHPTSTSCEESSASQGFSFSFKNNNLWKQQHARRIDSSFDAGLNFTPLSTKTPLQVSTNPRLGRLMFHGIKNSV